MKIVSKQQNNLVSGRSRRENRMERVAPLAVLPVFFNLQSKRAIVVGGTAAAAWKAELLAACGAQVEVIADELDAEMVALAETSPVTLKLADWREVNFSGAALVIADLMKSADAELCVRKARAAAVPINVIDNPAYCDFQFGSIVNRSPVVVSISTAGAAPILGQAVRRRIETVLPRALGEWGALALNIRARVMETLTPGPARRAFWERFVDMAFSGSVRNSADVVDEIAASVGQDAGKVTLVGAGPGDAELLTIKALRVLQAADVIFFDEEVSPDVLELARREARRLAVATGAQNNSHDLMVSLARQGKQVVRLMSGNPIVEQDGAALANAGIAVEIVPGVQNDGQSVVPDCEAIADGAGSVRHMTAN